MSIIAVKGFQDTGKSALAVAVIKEALRIGSWFVDGFRPTDVVSNCLLRWPGVHCINNIQMRKYVKEMIVRGLKHKIVFLDEADRLFPARFWHDAEQTNALLGLWQDMKLFNIIIYTAHIGSSIDLMLRETTQIELNPDYDEANDCIDFIVYNALYGEVYVDAVDNVSEKIFPDYDRWQVIGQIERPTVKEPVAV